MDDKVGLVTWIRMIGPFYPSHPPLRIISLLPPFHFMSLFLPIHQLSESIRTELSSNTPPFPSLLSSPPIPFSSLTPHPHHPRKGQVRVEHEKKRKCVCVEGNLTRIRFGQGDEHSHPARVWIGVESGEMRGGAGMVGWWVIRSGTAIADPMYCFANRRRRRCRGCWGWRRHG